MPKRSSADAPKLGHPLTALLMKLLARRLSQCRGYGLSSIRKLDEATLSKPVPAQPGKEVTYTNKKGKRVTVSLVNRFALIVVDAFSKFVWVRLLQTPKGAGVAAAWDGLKTNPDVIGIAKALDSVFSEINADLQDRDPPERLKDLRIKAGSDNVRNVLMAGQWKRLRQILHVFTRQSVAFRGATT